MTGRTLFVCPFAPAPNAAQAGHRLAYEYIRSLAAEQPVDLVLLLDKAERVADELATLEQVNVLQVFRFSRWSRLRGVLAGIWRWAPRFCTRYSTDAFKFVLTQLEAGSHSVLRCEFSQAMIYATIAVPRHAVRVVISLHDVQTQLVLRKSRLEAALFAKCTFDTEQSLLDRADELRVLSQKDAELLRSLFGVPAGKVHLQPVPLSAFVHRVTRNTAGIERGALLFWGAMGRVENESAAIRFIEETFLPLAERYPWARLYVVGSSPSPRLRRYEGRQIVITGFVEDPTTYFEKASLGVVPLLQGAGIKLKTLEMLACGIPVLATNIGAEGIPVETAGLQVASIDEFQQRLIERFESWE